MKSYEQPQSCFNLYHLVVHTWDSVKEQVASFLTDSSPNVRALVCRFTNPTVFPSGVILVLFLSMSTTAIKYLLVSRQRVIHSIPLSLKQRFLKPVIRAIGEIMGVNCESN